MKGLEPNVQRIVSSHLTPGEKRRLKIALSTTENAAAQVIQHAFRQFRKGQYVGQHKTLPFMYRGPWRSTGNRNVQARQLGIHHGSSVPTIANRWRSLARLPRGTLPFENRRSAYPTAITPTYSQTGYTIPYVPLFVKFLHSKSNQEFKNYVTQRYPTYYKAAQAFGQIDRYLKKIFYNNVKLLYPRLKKNWWLT